MSLNYSGGSVSRDHIYTDAALAKLRFRWRTALIVRELEEVQRATSCCNNIPYTLCYMCDM